MFTAKLLTALPSAAMDVTSDSVVHIIYYPSNLMTKNNLYYLLFLQLYVLDFDT